MTCQKTVCARDCYDSCTLLIRHGIGQARFAVRGDPVHPVTKGILCKRAAADPLRLQTNRIQTPYVRNKGRLVPLSWNKALDRMAETIQQTLAQKGPQHILSLKYAGNMGMLAGCFSQRIWNAIGATQTDETVCSVSGRYALQLHYGSAHGINPMDIQSKSLIVFWGFNAAVSAPHTWRLALRAKKRHGARIVAIDPIKTVTAKKADLWIQPYPGKDVALAYAVVGRLIQAGVVDVEFMNSWTTGFEQLTAQAGLWTGERAAAVTGVDIAAIDQLAALYAKAQKNSATLIGIGMQKRRNGADQVRAVSFIPTVLGIHRGFFFSNSNAHSVDSAYLKGTPFLGHEPPRVSQVALAEHAARGEFDVMYISCMNPALTLPHQALLRKGLSRPDVFVCVHDTHWTKTTGYADLVLPALTFFEKDDVVVPWSHNLVRFSRAVLPPITRGKTEHWVMRQIARRLKLPQDWVYENEIAALKKSFDGVFENGGFDDLLAGADLFLKRSPADRYPTPSGKIEFVSSTAKNHALPPLPLQSDDVMAGDAFQLLNGAVESYIHTQFQEVFGPIPAVAKINPADAAQMAIHDGSTVRLSNPQGAIEVTAQVDESVLPGCIWCPREFQDPDGRPQNLLTSSRPQSIGGGATFNSTRVQINGSHE